MWERVEAVFGQGFLPHGHCYLWTPSMVWAQVGSNTCIGLAYASIGATLATVVRRVRALPFAWAWVAFATFIVSCGLTHILDVVTVWRPVYWLDAGVRVVTAGASVATAVLVWPLLPQVSSLVDASRLAEQRAAALERAHRELEEANRRLATREQEASRRAEASELQLRELIDNLPDLAWTALPDGHIDFYNRRWFEFTGTTMEELEGWGWESVHDPEMLPRVREQWRRSLETGEPFEMEFPLRAADGSFQWFLTRIRPVRDPAGQIVRWFGSNTNIEALRRARIELRESLERHRVTFEQAPVGIAEVSLGGAWSRANPKLCDILGYDGPEDLGARTFQEVTAPEDLAFDLALVDEVLRGARSSYTLEKRYIRKDGRVVWAALTVALVRAAGGEPSYFIAVVEDIDARKRAEGELAALHQTLERRVELRTAELAEANRELEAFSYSVSHDLRAPLRAIAGFAKALREHGEERLDDDGRHYLGRIQAGATRMGALIDDLLTLSRLGRAPLARADVDLSAMVEAVRAALSEGQGRRITWSIQPGVRAHADEGLVRIALENLVGNAWKFSRERQEAAISFGAEDRGGERVYHVRDNGAGFDMAHAAKLFAPFHRLHASARFEGTGIGLATVQRIVRRHGGRVWAESRPEEGATFFFTLGGEDAGRAR
jgi:PAS domain S-box-containing protein